MVVTYVTYVRMLNPLGPMSKLISFTGRDYEAHTYTYVLGPIAFGALQPARLSAYIADACLQTDFRVRCLNLFVSVPR